jgi:hypothetical protein
MKIKKIVIVLLFILSVSPNILAQHIFEKDTDYDIYYGVGTYEINVVRGVKIFALIEIGGEQFLEISGAGFGEKEKKGYILFDSVKAILPSGDKKPERLIVENKSN